MTNKDKLEEARKKSIEMLEKIILANSITGVAKQMGLNSHTVIYTWLKTNGIPKKYLDKAEGVYGLPKELLRPDLYGEAIYGDFIEVGFSKYNLTSVFKEVGGDRVIVEYKLADKVKYKVYGSANRITTIADEEKGELEDDK